MKSFQQIVVLVVALVACASAFTTPSPMTRPTFSALQMSNNVEQPSSKNPNAAAIAAFATALAPMAAHADGIDEGIVIGYGAGLVACVVSLAVGFAIGYGTLVKP